MKLIEMRLINIGPYHIESISFNTNRSKNIVLLCGENGAGKTTFLRAVKLGLFGGALFGFKQQSRSIQYIDEVKTMLRDKAKNGSIDITFSIVENYQEVVYRIKRQWDIEPAFKEKIDLYVDGVHVQDDEMINRLNYINNFYTPAIVDSIMFDGEKIIGLIENGKLSNYVKDAIINLFGLNNYLLLIQDLDEYLNSYINKENLSIEQIQLNENEKNLKIIRSQLKKENEKLLSLQRLLEAKTFLIKENIEMYSKLGGINRKELSSVIQKISHLEKGREDSRTKLKEFLENDLLFLLNKKLIRDTIRQIKLEEPIRYLENLNDLLQANLLEEKDQEYVQLLISKINVLSPKLVYLNVTKREANIFKSYLTNIEKAVKQYKELSNDNGSDLAVIKELKNKVTISQQKEMEDIYNKITEEINQKENLTQELEDTTTKIASLEEEQKNIQEKVENLKKIVFEQTKNDNSYVLAKKYQDVCQTYYDSEIDRLTKLISKQCTKLIVETYRKENYITKLEIDTNFDVSIFKNDEKKSIQQLSAGEKQLLVASIISTIVRTSSRNTFIVFDTPVGRLDNDHMVRFYKNIMAESANQVIIMPTSKEINSQVINTIKSQVNECYTIKYDDKGYSKIMKNQIFGKEWQQGGTEN